MLALSYKKQLTSGVEIYSYMLYNIVVEIKEKIL